MLFKDKNVVRANPRAYDAEVKSIFIRNYDCHGDRTSSLAFGREWMNICVTFHICKCLKSMKSHLPLKKKSSISPWTSVY